MKDCRRCGNPLLPLTACEDGIDHTPDDTEFLEACRKALAKRLRLSHTDNPIIDCESPLCAESRDLIQRLNERLGHSEVEDEATASA